MDHVGENSDSVGGYGKTVSRIFTRDESLLVKEVFSRVKDDGDRLVPSVSPKVKTSD